MRARLRLPARLAVTVIIPSACSSPDAPADASVMDVLSSDTAVLDVLRDAPPADVAGDALDARACTRNPFDPESTALAVRCLPKRGVTMPCPTESVCVASDCPAHCDGCVSPLFCIPDNSADAGVACAVSTVCDPDACNPGCRAVG